MKTEQVNPKTFGGGRGWIRATIRHTGIGISFMVCNDREKCTSWEFSERRPINGPPDQTYTQLFLSALLDGNGRIHQRNGQVIIDTIRDRTRIEYYSYSVGDSSNKEKERVAAYFDAEQTKDLIDYLAHYIDALPQDARADIKKYQQDPWCFIVDNPDKWASDSKADDKPYRKNFFSHLIEKIGGFFERQ